MTDPERSRWRSFRDVDGTADPASLAAYLDDLAAIPAIAREKTRSLALLRLAPGAACLDIGCGDGPELARLAAIVGPNGRVVGLDRSATLIDRARARLRSTAGLELVVADAEALPFADGEFDACRADRTLQHLNRPDAALSEMTRVLRPGGRLAVTELRWGLVAPGLDGEVTRAVLAQMASSGDRRDWLGHRLASLLEAAGLTEVTAHTADDRLADYAEIARLVNVGWSVRTATEAGAVEPAAGTRWREDLRALANRGEAFAAVVILHVTGVRR